MVVVDDRGYPFAGETGRDFGGNAAGWGSCGHSVQNERTEAHETTEQGIHEYSYQDDSCTFWSEFHNKTSCVEVRSGSDSDIG